MGRIQLYITKILREDSQGFFSFVLKFIFLVFSWPYCLVVNGRNWLYNSGWFKQYDAPIPVVVSVGNIVAGGTGKTPFTIFLAKQFSDQVATAILTRGYRSPAEKQALPTVLSLGEGTLHSAAYCGDEPCLISENLPKAAVYVGKHRAKAALMAAKWGASLAVLDDGFQHRKLRRDYDIVILDSTDPFGCGYHLPRGFLREGLKSLMRADLIVINYVESQDRYNEVAFEVKKYTNAPIIGTNLGPVKIYTYQGDEISTIEGKKVSLFSGIGRPMRFAQTVKALGGDVVNEHHFPDHSLYCYEKLKKISEHDKSLGAELVICTEKDKVKLSEFGELALPLCWIKIDLEVTQNIEEWEKFHSQIDKKIYTP